MDMVTSKEVLELIGSFGNMAAMTLYDDGSGRIVDDDGRTKLGFASLDELREAVCKHQEEKKRADKVAFYTVRGRMNALYNDTRLFTPESVATLKAGLKELTDILEKVS